jgi:hypothetical protein
MFGGRWGDDAWKWGVLTCSVASRRVNSGEGGIRTPKPVSQFNGLANRKPVNITAKRSKGLRRIKVELSTDLRTYSRHGDPTLDEIVNVSAELPQTIRQAMVAMARATVKREDGE